MTQPLIAIIMGSKSDWETMEHATQTLDELKIPYEVKIVSAHRTPDLLFQYAESAHERGIEVIIAGAGGAAHLPGMTAAKTHLPVLGVPVQSKALNGMDSLLSIVQSGAPTPTTTAYQRQGPVVMEWLNGLISAGGTRELVNDVRYRRNLIRHEAIDHQLVKDLIQAEKLASSQDWAGATVRFAGMVQAWLGLEYQ